MKFYELKIGGKFPGEQKEDGKGRRRFDFHDKVKNILEILKAEGFTGIDSVSSLNRAVENGDFPTARPDRKMLRFLSASDYTLNLHLATLGNLAGTNNNQVIDHFSKLTNERVVRLLTLLYPGNIITPEGHSHFSGSFKFDGTVFQWAVNGSNFSTLEEM